MLRPQITEAASSDQAMIPEDRAMYQGSAFILSSRAS
jgi:hypothetical protein